MTFGAALPTNAPTGRNTTPASSHTLSLRRVKRQASHSRNKRAVSNTSALTTTAHGQVFVTDIQFGTQSFKVVVDTGSSDTWVPQTGFTCVNETDDSTLDESACGFGATYNIDDTFTQIQDENFKASYNDGETVIGIVGNETITLAGITVPSQEAGVVNLAAFHGDGVSSGILGLAFPSITSAFTGTDASTDQRNKTGVPYNPIFTAMFTSGLIDPVFSVSLNRDDTGEDGLGGSITFGGIPADVATTGSFATANLEVPNVQSIHTLHFPELQSYIITIDGIAIPGGGDRTKPAPVVAGTSHQYIIDTGSSLNFFDSTSTAAINALFQPPATLQQGAFFVDCNATGPSGIGVAIGGLTFELNSADLVVLAGLDPSQGCISGIQEGGNGESDGALVLGDVFLKSVLAVFDVGAGEMRIAAKN